MGYTPCDDKCKDCVFSPEFTDSRFPIHSTSFLAQRRINMQYSGEPPASAVDKVEPSVEKGPRTSIIVFVASLLQRREG